MPPPIGRQVKIKGKKYRYDKASGKMVEVMSPKTAYEKVCEFCDIQEEADMKSNLPSSGDLEVVQNQ